MLIWEITLNTETNVYSVINLVAQLEAYRKYVTSHDVLIMGSHGLPVMSDDMCELITDMTYEDRDPETGFSREYTYYLEKFPEGHEKHLLAIKNAISSLANHLLITDDGDCDWDNHRRLEAHGFDVRPGETDSCGWLTGRICCNDFEVYYG